MFLFLGRSILLLSSSVMSVYVNVKMCVSGLEYVKLVYSSIDDGTLWTAAKLRSMCQLEETYVRGLQEFDASCIHTTHSRRCCRSWSAGNYIALLANRSSCRAVSDGDVGDVLEMMKRCSAIFYADMSIPVACWDADAPASRHCDSVPHYCRSRDASIYHLLYHILDVSFLRDSSVLKYSVSYLPIARGVGARKLYDAMELSGPVNDGLTSVVAMDFGVKQDLFDQYVVSDLMWFCLALASVTIAVCLYTRSVFITLSAFTFIFFAVVVAYFMYGVVLRITFFPFMNLLAVVVLVAIGVDGVFVYLSVWHQAKHERDTMTPEQLAKTVLCHATPSALASSATTAAAFFTGGATSSVVVLRCFGIFAGLAVSCHFVILAVAMPAVLLLNARGLCTCTIICCSHCSKLGSYANAISVHVNYFIVYTIPRFIHRFRYVIAPFCGIFGVLASVAIFIYPKLQLPMSSEFQLFAADHPLEVYDLRMKSQFWFSWSSGLGAPLMPITVVWGIRPSKNLNQMDPLDHGTLQYDEHFEVGTRATRKFLLSFCRGVRQTRYYRLEPGMQLNNCFLENFERYMRRGCRDIDGRSLRPCCQDRRDRQPYNSSVFYLCIREYAPSLAKSSALFSSSRDAGLRFSKTTGSFVAIVVEFLSTEPFSLNYSSIGNFYSVMNAHVTEALHSAPEGLRHGFFVSYLDFYDLQHSLASGIPLSAGLAVAVAAGVAFLVTLNLLVTLYAMLAVLVSICITVAALVCLGWRLNVVESVTVSVAAGLSVDFVLHHAVAYCLAASQTSRQVRVSDAARVVSAPVALSAITTFLVGLCLTPSAILAYRQIGMFLMILVAVSWFITTFFFQALLCIAGPQSNFTQLRPFRKRLKMDGRGRSLSTSCHVTEVSSAAAESTATVASVNAADSVTSTTEKEHLSLTGTYDRNKTWFNETPVK